MRQILIIRQMVHTSYRIQREFRSGDRLVQLKAVVLRDCIDWGRNRTKAPLNLVHSYDTALIEGALWAGWFNVTRHGDSQPYMTLA